ncbi:MAG: hypothetical protein KAS07_00850 [Candidatus Pacebacteria bacterium]|nr:hypothetical protein [Candidatus Paceibacterota bacterium]
MVYTQKDRDMDEKVTVMLHLLFGKGELTLAIAQGHIRTSGAEDERVKGFLISPEFYMELVEKHDNAVAEHKRKVV